MHDPPGTIPPIATRLQARRPPAHRSVSLRHSLSASPPSKAANVVRITKPVGVGIKGRSTSLSSPTLASDKANPPSISPVLLSQRNGSGESSDAGQWFETANNNARQSSASYVDVDHNEPPFFLRNSSSADTPPEGYEAQHGHGSTAMPYRPGLKPVATTDGSSSEDFRSVIDDLTVANRKLKQRLRKYERMYDAHLQDQKLFEVKFHGLPDHKKKELQETLCKFAASLDEGSVTDYPEISQAPTLKQQKTVSSTSRFAESGYASMSASGQNSSAPSNQTSHQADDYRKRSRSAYNRQQQSIQSYLHDIPAGLLPTSNAPMTDKAKKKIVVRRLEQIFAGKRSAPGHHSQPLQQEEVAQSAATADREARGTAGQLFKPEGLRVARIMSEGGAGAGQDEAMQISRPDLLLTDYEVAGAGSPDQRPTRPLDLDLYRAQVPLENMDYIRHLGFTPPNMETQETHQDGHGWLYLNLLINMAQLHTLNVTPDYVKDALLEYSTHFEISHDGRKVRWKGNFDVTKDSSEGSLGSYSPYDSLSAKSPAKRSSTDHTRGSHDISLDAEQQAKRLARAKREDEWNKFAYTPMFFQKESSEEDDDYYNFDTSSSSNMPPQTQLVGDSSSSAMQSSTLHSGPPPKKKRDEGPMIFYSRAKFCTDLTGNRLGASFTAPGGYNTMTNQPLGAETPLPAETLNGVTEPRGPFDVTPMEVDSNPGSVSSTGLLGFSPGELMGDSGSNSPETIDFEASGLGGVHPEDNFSIHVQRSQTNTTQPEHLGRRTSIMYPKKIREALRPSQGSETKSRRYSNTMRVVKEEILSAARETLPNSTLPPASFLPLDSTSSAGVESDAEYEASSGEDSELESDDGPATALQILNISPVPSRHDGSSSEESEYSEDTDDGSMDLLATARQLDPNTVRAFEREYDSALADRLAEEIVPGGSAATAGGGSGFNSPADAAFAAKEASRRNYSSSQNRSSADVSSAPSLKRGLTSESMASNDGSKGAKTQRTQ